MERHVRDHYGDGADFANANTSADLKAKITGLGDKWLPNTMSEHLVRVVRSIISETSSSGQVLVTVVDFGCGLGRNLSLLKGIFPRVVGVDIPEMIRRLRSEQESSGGPQYDAIYDDVDALLRAEQIHTVYDSVVFQHIVDQAYVSDLVDRLVAAPSFVAIVSLSVTTSPASALSFLAGDHRWTNVYGEIDTTSFNGSPHQVRVLRRPRSWRLALRDDIIGIEPDGGDWRAVMIGGAPCRRSPEWRVVGLLTDLTPVLLLVFERHGDRGVWYVAESGAFLGNKVQDLSPDIRAIVRRELRQIVDHSLRRTFSGAGLGVCADLLQLVVPPVA